MVWELCVKMFEKIAKIRLYEKRDNFETKEDFVSKFIEKY